MKTETFPADKQTLDDMLSEAFFGRRLSWCLENNICVSCGRRAISIDFRDDISRKDYQITGFCQTCQDENEKHLEETTEE